MVMTRLQEMFACSVKIEEGGLGTSGSGGKSYVVMLCDLQFERVCGLEWHETFLAELLVQKMSKYWVL